MIEGNLTVKVRVKVSLAEVNRLLFVDAFNIIRHAPVHLKVAQILDLVLVLIMHRVLLAEVQVARLHVIVSLLGDCLAGVYVLDLVQGVDDIILALLLLADFNVDLKSTSASGSSSFLLIRVVRVSIRLIVIFFSVVHFVSVVTLVHRHSLWDAVRVGIVLFFELIIVVKFDIILVILIILVVVWCVLVHIWQNLVSHVLRVLGWVNQRLALSFVKEAIFVVTEIARAVIIKA